MIDFRNITCGVLLSLAAILFGGMLGLSFGCCEDSLKGMLKADAEQVLDFRYQGKQELADKVVKKSWVYMKRAHLHSQTMGVIAIVFSLLSAWFNFPVLMQIGISLLAGFGSLCYGIFWLWAALLAPALGSTDDAKHAVELVAQAGAGSFFVAGAAVFVLLVHKLFIQKRPAGEHS